MSDTTNDIDALLERIRRYGMFGFKGHGDMLYGLAFALEYLEAQPHSMQRARARACVADMKDLVIPIEQTLSDAGCALTALVAERNALRERVAELEAQPADRDLRVDLVCAALVTESGLHFPPSERAERAIKIADAAIAAMRKGESDGK